METYRVPIAVHFSSQVHHVFVQADDKEEAVENAKAIAKNFGVSDYEGEIEQNLCIESTEVYDHEIEITKESD